MFITLDSSLTKVSKVCNKLSSSLNLLVIMLVKSVTELKESHYVFIYLPN